MGLLISVIIPKIEVAMTLFPVIVIPLMVFGGFFVNNNDIVVWLRWIEWASPFKWGFQAAAIVFYVIKYNKNEYTDQIDFNCGCIKPNPRDPQYLLLK